MQGLDLIFRAFSLMRLKIYQILSQDCFYMFKGTVSRDFLLLVFFMNHFPLMVLSGARGKLIHKKTSSKESRDTAPLRPAHWKSPTLSHLLGIV